MHTTRQRAPAGYTYDPCPGCASDKWPRRKNGVCDECAGILKAAMQAKALQEADSSAETVRAAVPRHAHSLPYITHMPPFDDTVNEAFLTMANVISQPYLGGDIPAMESVTWSEKHSMLFLPHPTARGWWPRDSSDYRVFHKQQAEALQALRQVVADIIPKAYLAGKEDGTNLLASLNRGDLTNADFERRAGITPRE